MHKFPLISKSHYFHDHIPETAAAQGPIEMRLADFPGGPRAFETVARYCYNMDIEVTVEDVALTYCAAKYLRIPDLEKSTEKFMAEVVLPDPRRSAKVLQVATSLENMTDDMMEGLIGQSINAIAARFEAPLAVSPALVTLVLPSRHCMRAHGTGLYWALPKSSSCCSPTPMLYPLSSLDLAGTECPAS